MNKINIAIDGPSSSGKSSVAKKVAATLGYLYINTGLMYRAIALDAIQKKID
jgi:cytidylate kinase